MWNRIQTNQNPAGNFLCNLEFQLNLVELSSKYPQNPQTFGEIIRKARFDKGIQVKELARLIGVTPESINIWERHGRIPES